MPPASKPGPAGQIGREDFVALVDAIMDAIAQKTEVSLLVPQSKVPAVLGISRSAFFRLRGTTGFPRAVAVAGAGPHFRRSDLVEWAAKLKGRR